MNNFHTLITDGVIDIANIYSMLGDAGSGAAVLFVGRVRDENEGKKVVGIRYEVYKEMAEKECAKIWNEACAKWRINRGVIMHRVGSLLVGDISVVVGVATGHRAEAFEAAKYIIDRIKELAPIWKEEHYSTGEKSWTKNTP